MGTVHRIHPSLTDPSPQAGPPIYTQAQFDAAVAEARRKVFDMAARFVEAELSSPGPGPGRQASAATS